MTRWRTAARAGTARAWLARGWAEREKGWAEGRRGAGMGIKNGDGRDEGRGAGVDGGRFGGCAAGDRTATTYRSPRRLTAWMETTTGCWGECSRGGAGREQQHATCSAPGYILSPRWGEIANGIVQRQQAQLGEQFFPTRFLLPVMTPIPPLHAQRRNSPLRRPRSGLRIGWSCWLGV